MKPGFARGNTPWAVPAVCVTRSAQKRTGPVGEFHVMVSVASSSSALGSRADAGTARMNGRALLVCILAALAGLMFGSTSA